MTKKTPIISLIVMGGRETLTYDEVVREIDWMKIRMVQHRLISSVHGNHRPGPPDSIPAHRMAGSVQLHIERFVTLLALALGIGLGVVSFNFIDWSPQVVGGILLLGLAVIAFAPSIRR